MSRTLIFVYGVVVYGLFFAAFLYLFGFVGGLGVPKSINSGQVGPVWLAVLVDVGLIALFGAQHAIMARPAFKRRWTRIIPPAMERSTFVLATVAILGLLYWQWRPIPQGIWTVENPIGQAGLYAIFFAGIGLVLLSSFLIDHFDLFGLRQVFLHLRGKAYTQRPFVLRSLYRLVRHPLMTGFLLAFWATPHMTVGHLVFALAMTGYILIGTSMEERDLVTLHGGDYVAYQRRTPRFFPRLRPRSGGRPGVDAAPAYS